MFGVGKNFPVASLVCGFEAVLRDKVGGVLRKGFQLREVGEICVVRGEVVKDFFKVFSKLEFVSFFLYL